LADLDATILAAGGVHRVGGGKLAPMPAAEVAGIEHTLGVILPDDYRRFLLTYGACAFDAIVKVKAAGPLPPSVSTDGRVTFSYFFGGAGTALHQHLELGRAIAVFRDRMPRSLIPIGYDSGNLICLGISGRERGRVYYWDHHNEWDGEEYVQRHGHEMPEAAKFSNVYLVADSFIDLIGRMQQFDV
jgi:hypothetical protein